MSDTDSADRGIQDDTHDGFDGVANTDRKASQALGTITVANVTAFSET